MELVSPDHLLARIEELENRLAESEQLIEAIKAGEVDAFAITKNNQHQVFTLQSGDYAYRVLVENMGEAALSLTAEGLIVFCNSYFYRLANVPDGKALGSRILDYIHPDSKERFLTLFKQGITEQSKGEIKLIVNGEAIPVYISLTTLAPQLPTVGMIITDLRDEKSRKVVTRKYEEEVTIRRKVEESEKRYNMMLMQSPFAFAILKGKDMVISFANDSIKEIWGKGKDIEGKKLLEILPEIKDQVFPSLLEGVYTTGVPFYSYEILAKLMHDGQLQDMYFNLVYQPYYEADKTISGVTIIAIDVTKEVAAKNKFEEVTSRLAAIVQSSEDAIISKTLNGTITSWNPGAKKLFGYASEEMIGRPITKLIPPDRLNEEPLIIERIRKGESVEHFETKRLTKSGKLIDISLTISPVRDKKGNITGASKIARDITDDVTAREQLKESEKRFRELADSMPQIVWTAGPDGKVDYFNKQWYEYTGFEETSHNPQPSSLLHPEDLQPSTDAYAISIKTGCPFNVEYRMADRKKPGTYQWFTCRANPIKDGNGNIIKWFGTCTNIDDAKRIQESLQADQKRREDFIKMASHELKTPITTLKGHVQLMLSVLQEEPDTVLPNSEIEASLVTMNKQVTRLTRLISEMLDHSRIEAGELVLRRESFNLNKLVIETVQDLLYIHNKYTIDVIHDFECRVHADKDRIGQVLSNLLTNAIKYSPYSKKIEVRIFKEGEKHVSVSVKDEGIGIDKKEIKKIFERFYRVEGSSEQTYPGFGVGLYVVGEIIQRHYGTISVDSEKGKGSTFIFTLAVEN